MIKFNAKNLGIAVFLGVLLIGVIGIASAQQTLPTGGDSFDTAVTIEPGSYETVHAIAYGTYEYFKTTVNAGQTLKISITKDWGTDESAEATIYDSNRVELYGYGDLEANVVASWMTSSTGTFYIKIGGYVSDLPVGTSIDISVEDHYDANSGKDAGSTFDTALNVSAGDYDGYLAGGKYGDEPKEPGDDDKDYYIISLGSGQLLDVVVTPPSDVSFELKIYDRNRVEKASTSSANPGAITSTSWTAPSAQDVYVAITNLGGLWANGGIYSISLSITEGVEEKPDCPHECCIDEIYKSKACPAGYTCQANVCVLLEEGPPTEGPNWALILGIIAIIVVIGIVAYFFLKKKK